MNPKQVRARCDEVVQLLRAAPTPEAPRPDRVAWLFEMAEALDRLDRVTFTRTADTAVRRPPRPGDEVYRAALDLVRDAVATITGTLVGGGLR
ncbi:hypothetical protein [Amycolatopsis nigrescens]|uniref:hypothetical protein n=1 Tax=Amycolatopsis nigrescens TaxID=381445 RepID=UPI00036A0057|nr:hypothetical protein [Amycolatopsis nigrescens]